MKTKAWICASITRESYWQHEPTLHNYKHLDPQSYASNQQAPCGSIVKLVELTKKQSSCMETSEGHCSMWTGAHNKTAAWSRQGRDLTWWVGQWCVKHGEVDQGVGGQEEVRDNGGDDVQLRCKNKAADHQIWGFSTTCCVICGSKWHESSKMPQQQK